MHITTEGRGLGWLRDYPDWRDYTPAKQELDPPKGEDRTVPQLLTQVGVEEPKDEALLPPKVDLTERFSPIEDQPTWARARRMPGRASSSISS